MSLNSRWLNARALGWLTEAELDADEELRKAEEERALRELQEAVEGERPWAEGEPPKSLW